MLSRLFSPLPNTPLTDEGKRKHTSRVASPDTVTYPLHPKKHSDESLLCQQLEGTLKSLGDDAWRSDSPPYSSGDSDCIGPRPTAAHSAHELVRLKLNWSENVSRLAESIASLQDGLARCADNLAPGGLAVLFCRHGPEALEQQLRNLPSPSWGNGAASRDIAAFFARLAQLAERQAMWERLLRALPLAGEVSASEAGSQARPGSQQSRTKGGVFMCEGIEGTIEASVCPGAYGAMSNQLPISTEEHLQLCVRLVSTRDARLVDRISIQELLGSTIDSAVEATELTLQSSAKHHKAMFSSSALAQRDIWFDPPLNLDHRGYLQYSLKLPIVAAKDPHTQLHTPTPTFCIVSVQTSVRPSSNGRAPLFSFSG